MVVQYDEDHRREEDVVGEWRHVENIITISRDLKNGGLVMIADAAQPSLRLLWNKGNQWLAQQRRTGKTVYDVSLGSTDTLKVRKGDRLCKMFRIARSRSLVGEWVHSAGKSFFIMDGANALELRGAGKPTLRLIRRKIMEWDARQERDHASESVYLIDHMEGSDRIAVRRPDIVSDRYPILEFVRANSDMGHPAPSLTLKPCAGHSLALRQDGPPASRGRCGPDHLERHGVSDPHQGWTGKRSRSQSHWKQRNSSGSRSRSRRR